MRPRLTVALLAAACLATACKTAVSTSTTISGTPVVRPVPAPYNPAGKWSLGLVAQGQAMEVLMELSKLPDGTWTGTLSSAAFPPIPISKATLTDKLMVMTFPVPTGDMGSMTITFNGDLAEGEWSMPGDGSKVSGKKM
jgi:hypothetical protein